MADSVDTVSKIVTYHIADAVGATIAALALCEENRVRVVGLRGLVWRRRRCGGGRSRWTVLCP